MKKIKKLMMSLLLVLGIMIVGTVNSTAGSIGYGGRFNYLEITFFKTNNGGVLMIVRDLAQQMQWTYYAADEDSDPVLVDARFYYGNTQNFLPKLPTATNATNIAVGSSNSLGMQSMNGSNAELLNRSFELDNEENNDW